MTIRPADLYYNHMFGFFAGAGCKTIDKNRAEHADESMRKAYADGWKAGKEAIKREHEVVQKLYGYTASIIRHAYAEDETRDDK